jgi:hypothetical protein
MDRNLDAVAVAKSVNDYRAHGIIPVVAFGTSRIDATSGNFNQN